jgi:hydroxymethylpyrimidine/phosphomethylpyrimidine kinase
MLESISLTAPAKIPVAMTIAGSDPGGGAGLQADLKTFAALKVYGFSVITAVIAQNSSRVARVAAVTPALVAAQIETLLAERRPDALKTGALASAAVAATVADLIAARRLPPPVVDPVMISSSGARLLDARGDRILRDRLLPLARIVTPNIPEAELLSGVAIDGLPAMRAAARALRRMGARAVVIKGGHPYTAGSGTDPRLPDRADDLFYDGRNFAVLAAARISGGGAHGTGCAFAAAIAAWLARGVDLETAVRRAKSFVNRALRRGFNLGAGRRLLDHFARE